MTGIIASFIGIPFKLQVNPIQLLDCPIYYIRHKIIL